MSDENQVDLQEEVSNDVQQEVKVDPYEEEARAQGWKPKEEYEGDEHQWRNAKEFVERGELFSKIDSMGRELKETRKAMRMLQEHNSQIKVAEYNKALTELKNLQKKHLEEGNADGYLETSELLTDLKAEQKAREVVSKATPQAVDPRFTSWVSQNKWYEQDQELRDHADIIGQRYAASNPELDPEDVLKFVTNSIKQRFPTKFANPNRTKPGAVASSNTTSVAQKGSQFEMTDDEKRVMNTFVRTGVMTKEEYIKQLKTIRGVV